jgi:hypothetical protein
VVGAVAAPRSEPAGRKRPRSLAGAGRGPLLVLGALFAADLVLLLYAQRGLGFFYDEWNFVLNRHQGGVSTFLEPHNEHFSLIPVVVYKLLFATVGLDPHWPYLALLAFAHIGVAACVFSLARGSVGDWGAVIATAPVLFLGLAWEDLVWAFQIGFVGSVLAGLGAFLALEHRTRRGDVVAAVLVFASLACSSLGVPFLLGAAAELAVLRRWRAWPVVAVPGLLYALWYLGYGKSAIGREGVINAQGWSLDAAAAAVGSLLGRGLDWGRPLAVACAAALAVWIGSGRVLSARLIGLMVAGGSFWILTGMARSTGLSTPEAPRYLYFGAIVVVLIACELLRGFRPPPRALWVAAFIVAFGVFAGLDTLRDGVRGLRETSHVTQAELAAVELVGAQVDPAYQPDPVRMPQVTAAGYLRAVADVGDSPAVPAAELPAAGGAPRIEADRVLVQAGAVGAEPGDALCASPAPSPGQIEVAPGGTVSISVAGAGSAVVRARRFAPDAQTVQLGTARPGQPLRVSTRRDASPVPWQLTTETTGRVSVCTRAG